MLLLYHGHFLTVEEKLEHNSGFLVWYTANYAESNAVKIHQYKINETRIVQHFFLWLWDVSHKELFCIQTHVITVEMMLNKMYGQHVMPSFVSQCKNPSTLWFPRMLADIVRSFSSWVCVKLFLTSLYCPYSPGSSLKGRSKCIKEF